jgi:hypothetical protein
VLLRRSSSPDRGTGASLADQRIALVLPSREIRDLDSTEVNDVLVRYPEVEREWRRWSAKTGGLGRLLLIDQTLVQQILSDLEEQRWRR